MSLESVKVFAPATVANVASGFDVLGFALERPGDAVRLTRKTEKRVDLLAVEGDGGRLPLDPARNTAGVAVTRFLEARGWPFGVDIVLKNLESPRTSPVQMILEPELVIRRSVAPAFTRADG